MLRTLATILLVLILAAPAAAGEKDPAETVRHAVNDTIAALKKDAPDSELRDIADTFFDWIEMSKRTLSRSWNDFSVEQRKEFVQLYSDLLFYTYNERLRDYTNEKVEIIGDTQLREGQNEVQTVVKSKGSQIPIDYRLKKGNKGWLVYDVIVEQVSLIKNYRSQFKDQLLSKSPEELLDTLRKKVEEKRKKS
jgi:phospholipid transport system substrate-binding protein